MKPFSFTEHLGRRGRIISLSAAAAMFLFLNFIATAEDDIFSEVPEDVLSTGAGGSGNESSPATENSPSSDLTHVKSDKKKKKSPEGLSNIVLEDKSVRAYGWGEYKVMGRCLCCDNALDGDCILVQTTNRTDRIRIKQIIDGDIAGDPDNPSTYFGDVTERETSKPVTTLMVEITMKNPADVYEVILYTMVDKEKKRSYLSKCELGYYDRFDRLKWVAKKECKPGYEYLSFQMERPILTKDILIKIEGGKSRVTEVFVLGKNID